MADAMPQANTPTSSNPEADTSAESSSGMRHVCLDPHNPELPCPICGGYGYYRMDVPVSDARFGKLHRCPNNALANDAERQERLRRLSNMEGFSQKSFHNFEIDRTGYTYKERESLRVAWQTATGYAETGEGWLLLVGGYGCGKTHLAAAVGNARLAQGDSVIFQTTPDLLDHLRSTYRPNAEIGYDELFERIKNVKLLILDDLGVENPSEWAQEKLYQLINHRYATRRSTVITTNADLNKLDPRIASRLRDANLVRRAMLRAPDYRDNTRAQTVARFSRLHLYQRMNFESFDIRTGLSAEQSNHLQGVTRKVYEYARTLDGWILLMGEHGSGKTHLAAAAAQAVHRRDNHEVLFVDVPQLMGELRSTFDNSSNLSFDDVFEMVQSVELLILDDISEGSKPWMNEKLFQLLEYRYLMESPTILTTSLQFDNLPARLRSRLLDTRVCRIIPIQAPSYAVRLKNQR